MKNKRLLIAAALVVLVVAGCSPSSSICKETIQGDFVCVDYLAGAAFQIDPGQPRDEYDRLTIDLQNVLKAHYDAGGSDKAAAQAIADLITLE